MEFVRRRRILRSSCPRDVNLFLLFLLSPAFLIVPQPLLSVNFTSHGRRCCERENSLFKNLPLLGRTNIRAISKETRKHDGSLQDFSTFIERIGSAHYFSKSSRNGNSKRIISGPPFSLPLPKWRNIVGDESGGVERYKGGGGCRV